MATQIQRESLRPRGKAPPFQGPARCRREIFSRKFRLNEFDDETRWRVPAVLHVDGREHGVYEIERGLLLWEWVTLSDGELARLVTNINEREIPSQYLRLDVPSGRILHLDETRPGAVRGVK